MQCANRNSLPENKPAMPCISALIRRLSKVLGVHDASHHPGKGYSISEDMKIKNEKASLLHNSTIKIKQRKSSPEFHH